MATKRSFNSNFNLLQLFIDPGKLLPLNRFLPKPAQPKGPKKKGGAGRGGFAGRGGGGGRGGFGGRGGGGRGGGSFNGRGKEGMVPKTFSTKNYTKNCLEKPSKVIFCKNSEISHK